VGSEVTLLVDPQSIGWVVFTITVTVDDEPVEYEYLLADDTGAAGPELTPAAFARGRKSRARRHALRPAVRLD